MGQIENIDRPGCPSSLSPPSESVPVAAPDIFVQRHGDQSKLDLIVFGAKCAGCIAKIEGGLKPLNGVEEARLNLSTGKLHVVWSGELPSAEIIKKISDLGYRAAPYDPAASEKISDDYGRQLIRCLAVAGFATANVMLISIGVWAGTNGEMGTGTRSLMHFVSAIIAIPAALYAGRPFFTSAWNAITARGANMDVPISLAVFLALGFSLFETFNGGEEAYFDAAVMLLFFLLVGRWLDHNLRNRARAAARDLVALQAVTANRLLANGMVEAVSAKEIVPGNKVLLSPGDRVPVDGSVIDGASHMDVSLVTGESAPAFKRVGDRIEAGVLNISDMVTMVASATVDNSLVAELTRMVEAGQQTKSQFVRLADKAARAYVPIVHTLALATFLGWFFIAGAGVRVSLMNAIAVLIITCPCALGLATPAVQIVATGRLFRDGILVKTGDALERLAQVTHFVFDKTGTITLGKMQLLNLDEVEPKTLAAAAALARASRHPVSRAIVRAAGTGIVAKDVVEEPGAGVSGTVDGICLKLGSADFVGVPTDQHVSEHITAWIKIDDSPPRALYFDDTIRPDAWYTVNQLKQSQKSVSLLSGDHVAPVRRVAAETGIENWTSNLTPGKKIAALERMENEGELTAMVGDGLNDTPALACAHVSLSPGTATEAAQSAADFVFQGESLMPVLEAWHVAKKAQGHIVQNFIFAALYNCVAAPLAMAGFVTPLIAALAMSGSSLVVTLNALRLTVTKKVRHG